ncbi:YbaB/EbfC family nucleoid-associated protein [Microbacterium sp. RG1]|uniref:YbaB/EbfC family nucleoid-associated protein n=1 Tax=Microbacterium sp. RG1 TaxID=2489212 RepID=UPI0010CA5B45|nr:YbaB/EbfC family nucleoid-associated protein [Microbacterium sp. RG1]QCQ17195.1 hypothetical protein EHF32_10930 [Microbacterium sp. RG1]
MRRAEERGALLPQLQAAIDEVRGRAVSLRRDVSVEVDSSGALRSVNISDAALERGGRRVSEEVMELVRKATQDARAQTLARTVEILGEDDPLVRVVAADFEADETGDHSWRFGGRA